MDENGKPTFTLTHQIDDQFPPNSPQARSSEIAERGVPGDASLNCVNNGLIYDYDLKNAQSMLGQWCDAGNTVWGSSLKIVQYYTASTYLCNYSGSSQGCSSEEVYSAGNLTVAQCGKSNGGNDADPSYHNGTPNWNIVTPGAYDWIGSWDKTYGFDKTGASICSNL
ncbi:hypothetical protein MMC28_000530 [Mycoblastus sanguinarius]|nr:hypothetical protein [Mycoblastus sanguinarius]